MATVSFDKATRLFPKAERPAVDALDLDIADGEFLVLVGPSGCGKSTSLRMLAGLEEVSSGAIRIGGEDMTQVQARDRDVAMVFQSYALYPTMTVEDNMGFALRNMGTSKGETKRLVAEAARILQLEDLLRRKPGQLSGGQRQRVAMGRAIVRRPQVFCMDEPLSNLDAKLRVSTRSEIAALQRRLGITTVYVTHDQTEAMTMGHRVAVLDRGVLQQVGTPREMYDAPVNTFVAGFIGTPGMNLFRVPVDSSGIPQLDGSPVENAHPVRSRSEVVLGVRPESLELVSETSHGLDIRVTLVEELGLEAYVHGRAVGTAETLDGKDFVVRTNRSNKPSLDDVVRIAPSRAPGSVLFFDTETGRRISADD
ncbi:ABC transporter ATP-binding protein [Dietzia sp.]|uniref:ABC transporter ATP-binding protein n=1 Tax=Dietzia sp. TaxID=1871616 RepID=UPI002FD98BC2